MNFTFQFYLHHSKKKYEEVYVKKNDSLCFNEMISIAVLLNQGHKLYPIYLGEVTVECMASLLL